jgi:acetylornithine aminotransferase
VERVKRDMRMRMFPKTDVSITAVKAYDTKILTEEYGELVDFESGCWAAVLGHCRKEIVDVLTENAGLMFHTHQFIDTEHPSALVDELTEAANLKSSYKGTFISSGSEAVSLAINLAEFVTGRKKKLSFTISYLGASPDLKLPRNHDLWTDINIDECLSCNNNSGCKECGKFHNIDFSQFAGFVFEPGNSGGLVLCPPEKLIEYIVAETRNAGGLIIANEVTTGFGRTGKWFGFNHYGIFDSEQNSPDLISLGKGLGNGYPISGVLVKSKLADAIESSNYKYVQSHIDDPLGCMVARKVVQILKNENLIEHGNKIGEYLHSKLLDVGEITDGIKEVRGRGMMNVVILNKNHNAKEVFKNLLEEGFFTGYSEAYNFIHLYAPLTISCEEIDSLCRSIVKIMQNSKLVNTIL